MLQYYYGIVVDLCFSTYSLVNILYIFKKHELSADLVRQFLLHCHNLIVAYIIIYRIAGYFRRGKFSPLPGGLYCSDISPEIFSPLLR